jgi:hypothetical protein
MLNDDRVGRGEPIGAAIRLKERAADLGDNN